MKITRSTVDDIIKQCKNTLKEDKTKKINISADLLLDLCKNLNAERYKLTLLNRKHSIFKQQLKESEKRQCL